MDMLFIENEENAILGLKMLLEAKEHVVNVAKNADEAAARLREKKYGLILLDIMIEPGEILSGVAVREAGKELLLRLRNGGLGRIKTSKDVRVVAITAVSELSVIDTLNGIENVCTLRKPIDPEDALKEVEKFILGDKSG